MKDAMQEALMRRKSKPGMGVTIMLGAGGPEMMGDEMSEEDLEKTSDLAPDPKGDEEGGDEDVQMSAGPDGESEEDLDYSPEMDERELEMLKGKSKMSLGERAMLEAAMKAKRK